MSKERINYLLKKYENNHVKGETFTKEYNRQLNKEYELQWKIDKLNQLCNIEEVSESIREDCVYWLRKISDIQVIYGKWSTEKCLAVIVLNQLQLRDNKFNIEKSYLWNKYCFNYHDYSVARSNLIREILFNHVILRDPENYLRYYNMMNGEE